MATVRTDYIAGRKANIVAVRRDVTGLPKACTGWNSRDGVMHGAAKCPIHDVEPQP